MAEIKAKAEDNAAAYSQYLKAEQEMEKKIANRQYKKYLKMQGLCDCNCEGSFGYDDDGEIRHLGLDCTFEDDSSDE